MATGLNRCRLKAVEWRRDGEKRYSVVVAFKTGLAQI